MKQTSTKQTKKPNILLILTDQHRLSALGCYGQTQCKTPNIDRLAREGILFENAYTTCPLCSPARATIMTGQYPHSHGVTANCGSIPCAVWNITQHPRMLPYRLQDQGYSCGYTGKWHLCPDSQCVEYFNQPIPHSIPSDFGFEGQNFMGHGGGGFCYQEYQDYLVENGFKFLLKPGSENLEKSGGQNFAVQDGPKEATVDHFLANNTISLIDRFNKDDEPFFIWHNNWGPHEPYYPVEEFYKLYRYVDIPQWANFKVPEDLMQSLHQTKVHPQATQLNWDYWSEAIRHYYAFTTQIDDQIGRIITHLEKTGILDDTIIIFSSDHGETLGSHGGMIDKGYSHFEEIQRIGMIVRYPEKYRPKQSPQGSIQRELVSLVDIYPTCLELAGITDTQINSEGISLHSRLEERAPERDAVFIEFFGMRGGTLMMTCRSGNWKYGWNMNGQNELYDLANDPNEIKNLADAPECYDVCDKMLEKIITHLPQGLSHEAQRDRDSLNKNMI